MQTPAALKSAFLIFVLFSSAGASAQTDSAANYNSDKLGLTVTLGLNSLERISQFPGFTFGLGNEYFVAEKISLHPQVLYSSYSYRLSADIYRESYVLELPLHVLFRPFKWKLAPYVSAGGSCKMVLPSFDSRLFAEAAFGLERDFGYTALAPEFRVSYGKQLQVYYFVMNFRF